MLRRIISVLAVAAIMAAMLVLTAAPAVARNCFVGQFRATFNQPLSSEQNFKHLDKLEDCFVGQSPGEGHDK